MSNKYQTLIKEAAEKLAAENGNQHPVEKAIQYIKTTPLDMLPHSTKTNADGSCDVTIHVPSIAEQEKKKAEEEAMRIQQQRQQQGGNVIPMGAGEQQQQGMAAAAKNKIPIKVAMGEEDETTKVLKGKYPDSFLKAMGL